MATIYDYKLNDLQGNPLDLSAYAGKKILLVNTASACGLTPQYAQLQELHETHNDKVQVIGLPCNDFGGQEPGTSTDIKAFCTKNYGVTFPMFSKISVKGNDIDPLYKYLTNKSENGVIDAPVKWNYQKFIINKEGNVVASIAPRTTVNDQEFMQNIEDLLK